MADLDVSEKETLRLLKAFFQVRDPQTRAVILKLVEDVAAGETEPNIDRLFSQPL